MKKAITIVDKTAEAKEMLLFLDSAVAAWDTKKIDVTDDDFYGMSLFITVICAKLDEIKELGEGLVKRG